MPPFSQIMLQEIRDHKWGNKRELKKSLKCRRTCNVLPFIEVCWHSGQICLSYSSTSLRKLLQNCKKNSIEIGEKPKGIETNWESLIAGMLCCARYTEDDMWYRAQIQSVEHQKPLEVKALYVDYGTTEVLKADRLEYLVCFIDFK